MQFKPYPKIHRLGKEEVDGILLGKCYIEEKIDGANTSIWIGNNGEIRCGSRTQDITDGTFNGFIEYVNGHDGISKILKNHPDYRLYGEWLCLSGDTIIKKVSAGKNGKGNFMSIKEMYDYYSTAESGRKKSWWKRYGMPSLYSLYFDKDIILPNKIIKIVKTGIKECYEIETRLGYKIKSSPNHKFLTNRGWQELSKLTVGDVVATSPLRRIPVDRNLGVGATKILKEQKKFKKDNPICVGCGAITSLELDHIDEDFKNNNPSNWQVLCSGCHRVKSGLAQTKTKAFSKGYRYSFDNIVSITRLDDEEMYDIEMGGAENTANFVAQGFIVHNCRHSIPYDALSYKKFYLFDIMVDDKFLDTEDVYKIAEEYNINHPELFAIKDNPTLDDIKSFAGKSILGPVGEGVVIKNHSFVNSFGDCVYAKFVTERFKETNSLVFGGNHKDSESYWEMYVVNKYITVERIQKIMNKMQPSVDKKLDLEHIPMITGCVYHDMLTEDIWEISKKVQCLNFKTLKSLCFKKIAQIYKEIITNDISVAHI